MFTVDPKSDPDWLPKTSEAVRYEGCAVVVDVLEREPIECTRSAMYEVQARIHKDIGQERLGRAGERGVLRLMPRYDPHFLKLLELPEMLALVDHLLCDTAILHLQNGFILPPTDETARSSFQHTFHRDFPRCLNGYLASLNVMLTLDAFTTHNGGTLVALGTQQRSEHPRQDYLEAVALPVECPAGAMIVFDSTLWHAAGANGSDRDRLAINHQFTRSYFKQQIDYVRALGESLVLAQSPRVQQLLGWYTRVVTNLDEYYRPTEERLYRPGQG